MTALDRFRPWLRFDSRELYAPCAVEAMVDVHYVDGPGEDYGCTLKRRDPDNPDDPSQEVLASISTDPPMSAAFLGAVYPSGAAGSSASEHDFLDSRNSVAVADSRAWLGTHCVVVYGRDTTDTLEDGSRWLQYWFFYYFNGSRKKGLGQHEGDWEMIQIRLDESDKPAEMTYAQHNKAEQVPWDPDRVDFRDEAPIVYVAFGSHASLPTPGKHEAPVFDDLCDGNGHLMRPTLIDISAEQQSWLHWPGRWGASRDDSYTLQVGSPCGPAFQRAWKCPSLFHADAAAFGRQRFRPVIDYAIAPPPIGGPAVTIDPIPCGAVVRYQVPNALEGDWIGEMRIWVRNEGDGLEVLHTFNVTGGSAEGEATLVRLL